MEQATVTGRWEATVRAPALPKKETRESPGKRGNRREMATGEITTLPSTPEDGGSGGFPPGSFKDPKRLYCKNGGFFLRIKSDGGVDGIREKNDPHSKCFQPPLRPALQSTQSFFMFFFLYATGK